MTKRTRAQKIASRMRQFHTLESVPRSAPTGSGTTSPQSPPPPGHLSLQESKMSSLIKQDLRKTVSLTLLVTALLFLAKVLQYKGYF